MLRICIALLWISLVSSLAAAGGRGGHFTTFDANLFGGAANVSCLCSAAIPGVCATGYSGTCNGVASDATALVNWRAAVSGSSNLTVLYCAPGKTINAAAGDQLVWDGTFSGNLVPNAVIWGYGCTSNFTNMGGMGVPLASGFPNACTYSARVSTVSAGATSVTIPGGLMVDGSSDAGVFPMGTQVLIAGVALEQFASYPPNPQFYEFAVSTGQSGNVVSLAAPLKNSYESTWPAPASVCPQVDLGGPATIYKLINFNTSYQIFGLTNIGGPGPGGLEFQFAGKKVVLTDVVAIGGFPTQSPETWSFFSVFTSMEIDKILPNTNFYRGSIRGISGFSSPATVNLMSVTIGVSTAIMPNLTAVNSDLGPVQSLGSEFGQATSIVLDGTKITTPSISPNYDLISLYTYSAGVFTWTMNSSESYSALVPGFKYHLQWYPGGPQHVNCSPDYGFTVSDISTTGTDFKATTMSWTQDGSPISTPATLPALVNACAGQTANIISGYLAKTITQINSPAGSTDLRSQAAPP